MNIVGFLRRDRSGALNDDDARRALQDLSSVLSAFARARLEVGLARGAFARSYRSLARAGTAIGQLPLIELPLTASRAGREIAELLDARKMLLSAARPAAVLALPGSEAEYLRGNRRQALRTNTRRAREAGIIALRVEDTAEVVRLKEALASGVGARRRGSLLSHVEQRLANSGDEFWFALDAEKRPVAVAVFTVDRFVARPVYAVSVGNESGEVLYLYVLNAEIIRSLIERGCRYIVAESALVQEPGVQYFRERLGFELRRVRHVETQEPAETSGRA